MIFVKLDCSHDDDIYIRAAYTSCSNQYPWYYGYIISIVDKPKMAYDKVSSADDWCQYKTQSKDINEQ